MSWIDTLKQKNKDKKSPEYIKVKSFLDCISPSMIKFYTDYYIYGNQYRTVWAVREYPSTTEEMALLRYLGEKDGVTLHIYTSPVSATEEQKIISNAINSNKLKSNTANDVSQVVSAESNVKDIVTMLGNMHRSREPLLHCSVFLEMSAASEPKLRNLKMEVLTELTRSKLNVDRLILRQKEGFLSVYPVGTDQFSGQYSRILPASSVANLFPFNYSGHTDPYGFCIGKDKYGSQIIIDLDARTSDRTNSNILILGNSGQGKSYLLKLLLLNFREAGNRVFNLDSEGEYIDMGHRFGDVIDLTNGKAIINILEPKRWSWENEHDQDAPASFNDDNVLTQHLSFLRDFFRVYKQMNNSMLEVLEFILLEVYEAYNIKEGNGFHNFDHTDYPIMSDLYDYIQHLYDTYDQLPTKLYTKEMLRELLLSLHSISYGADSLYFNGHTNIKDGKFVVFAIKGIMNASQNLKDAMLFNILSYLSNELLTKGNAVASLDEFYLFLTNKVAVEYVRNLMKRNRKQNSKIIIASQNLEDFNQPELRELTKPLFAIPTYQFLFHAGTIDKRFYIDSLQLEENEYDLIKYPERGCCLFKCGNHRFHLKVEVPAYKAKTFGDAGGK